MCMSLIINYNLCQFFINQFDFKQFYLPGVCLNSCMQRLTCLFAQCRQIISYLMILSSELCIDLKLSLKLFLDQKLEIVESNVNMIID